jgi:alkanesulfonate monooxygenase SsuD/methylene tetrahydromethanopterin reductase-like flavin-dependent oxidoreductase (luciferase family)
MDSLKDSPAVLVGTAVECVEKLLEWRERFGITYWHLGPDVEAVSSIVERLRSD